MAADVSQPDETLSELKIAAEPDGSGDATGEGTPERRQSYADRLSRARAGNTARRASGGGGGSPGGGLSPTSPSSPAPGDGPSSPVSQQSPLRPSPSEAEITRRLSRAGDGSGLTMLVRLTRNAQTGSLGVSLQYDDPNKKPPVVSACEASAEASGLKPGDQLLEIDGKRVDTGKQLAKLLTPKKTEFQIKLRRHGPEWKELLGYPG